MAPLSFPFAPRRIMACGHRSTYSSQNRFAVTGRPDAGCRCPAAGPGRRSPALSYGAPPGPRGAVVGDDCRRLPVLQGAAARRGTRIGEGHSSGICVSLLGCKSVLARPASGRPVQRYCHRAFRSRRFSCDGSPPSAGSRRLALGNRRRPEMPMCLRRLLLRKPDPVDDRHAVKQPAQWRYRQAFARSKPIADGFCWPARQPL